MNARSAAAGGAPDGRWEPADVGRRVGADVIDFVVLLTLGLVVTVILRIVGLNMAETAVGGAGGVSTLAGLGVTIITLVAHLVVHLGYWLYTEGSRARSIGKMVMNLKVVRPDGSPIDHADAFRRRIIFYLPWLMAWIPWFPIDVLVLIASLGLLLAGLISYLVNDPDHRGFHDRFAGTVVIQAG
ncbi:MAG: RDD family protein [Actinobacteria bacterium]|nr:RDD family protein [Actinomycetota bacterium]